MTSKRTLEVVDELIANAPLVGFCFHEMDTAPTSKLVKTVLQRGVEALTEKLSELENTVGLAQDCVEGFHDAIDHFEDTFGIDTTTDYLTSDEG